MSTMTDPITGEVFEYRTRQECRLRSPRRVVRIDHATKQLYAHHTVTATGPGDAIWRGVQNYHMDGRGWSDVAYSYAYDQDGVIYEGRGFGVVGGHTQGHNSSSYAFVFIGNSDNDVPTEKAKRAFNCLVHLAEKKYGRQNVGCHRDVGQTGCPGKHLTDWVRSGRRVSAGWNPPPEQNPEPVIDSEEQELMGAAQDIIAEVRTAVIALSGDEFDTSGRIPDVMSNKDLLEEIKGLLKSEDDTDDLQALQLAVNVIRAIVPANSALGKATDAELAEKVVEAAAQG